MLGMTMAMNSEAAGGGASVVLEPETETLVAAMTPEPDFARQIVINNLIVALKAAGIWSLLDVLWVFAAHAQQPATLNWKAPASFTATPVSAPTFTVDRGFTGNGTTSYLAPGWSPDTGVQYQQNSAHLAGWSLTAGATSNTQLILGMTGAGPPSILLVPRAVGDAMSAFVNDDAATAFTNASQDGFFVANRSGASARQGYRNGVSLGSDALASTGEPSSALTFLRFATNFSTLQIAHGSAGASLTAPQVSSYYNALLSYMQAVGADSTTGFVLTDIASGRLFQRTKTLTTGPVSASGTYSGGAPSAIELQVLLVSDDSVVKDWTTASGSIAAGTWSGTITGVPQGGSYYVKARPANAPGLAQAGSNPFYVGIMIVMYGQSNMAGMSTTTSSPPAATAGTTYYNGSAWVAVPSGNGVREMLNGVIGATSIPCAALNGAVSGVDISLLEKGQAAYTNLAAQITAAGADFEFIAWHQGEGDSAADTPQATYLASLSQLHSDLVTDFGRTKAQAPIIVAGLASVTNGAPGFGDDASWDAMERTLIDAGTTNASTTYSHSNRDANIVNADVHWDGPSYGNAGKRYVRSITTLLGLTSGFPNWHIASAAVVNATTTTVDLIHGLGTDFTPTSGITGFEVSGDNGANWVAPSTAVRTNATRITLTHSSLATDSNRKLRYQYGILPDISGIVLDNSSVAVPLDNSAGVISPTPLASLPVPTYLSGAQTASSGASQSRTGVSTGPASPRKVLIFTWTGAQSGSAAAVTQVDVVPNVGTTKTATVGNGGIVVQQNSSQPYAGIGFVVLDADADTSTTADFNFTFQGNPFGTTQINVWTVPLADLSSTTPTGFSAVRAATNTTLSTTIATSAGGFVIAAGSNLNFTSNPGTLSGTETYATRRVASAGSATHIAGDSSGVAANAASTVTETYTSTAANLGLVAASWR